VIPVSTGRAAHPVSAGAPGIVRRQGVPFDHGTASPVRANALVICSRGGTFAIKAAALQAVLF